MMKSFTILYSYNTSLGFIAILGTSTDVIPKVGMNLKNDRGIEWKITGTGMNKKQIYDERDYDNYVSVWDCILDAKTYNNFPKNGDTLFAG